MALTKEQKNAFFSEVNGNKEKQTITYESALADIQKAKGLNKPATVSEYKENNKSFIKSLYEGTVGTSIIKPIARTTEAVTRLVAPNSQAAQGYEQMADEGQSQNILGAEVTPVKAFGEGGGRQVVGEALQAGANLFPVGRGAGALTPFVGKTLGTIGAGAAAGYTADVGYGLDSEQSIGQALTPGLGTAIGGAIPAVAPIARGVGKLTKEVLGKTTGVGSGAIEQGLTATQKGGASAKTFREALRGKTNPEQIVEEAKQGLQSIKQTRSENYINSLKQVVGDNQKSYDITPVIEEVKNGLNKFGVNVLGDGTLDFSRSTLRFNKSAQADITTIVDEMRDFGLKKGDRTVLGLDSLKRAIGDIYTPSGEARAFVQGVKSKVRSVLSDVPGYDDLAKNYEEATSLIDEIQRGLSLGDKASIDTAYRKLTSSLRTNNELRKEFIQELDAATGGELLSKIAGQQMSEVLPRGLSGVLTATGGGIGIASGIGVLPIISAALTTSPRVVGEIIQALGFVGKNADEVMKLISKNAGKLQFPGDMAVDDISKRIDDIKSIPNKQGGFIKNPLANTDDALIQEAKKDLSYRSTHQIDTKNAVPVTQIDDKTLESFINDFKYQYGYPSLKSKEINRIKEIINNPEKEIKIYRASPKNELNSGDWVTIDKVYANDIKKQNGGKVYEYTVKANNLYYPKTLDGFKELPSLNKWGAFQFIES